MAHITADRVKEITTTTGTGSYTLAGAATGFRAFSAVAANNDTVPYCCEDGTSWEVGVGTWTTGGTLARTTILASSNNGNAVNWGAGTKNIFITLPARAATADVQEFKTPGTSTWTKPAGAKIVHIVMHGGGGGGGSGRRRGTSETSNAQGGGGGVSGARVELWLVASSLGATETVVVGAGGAGGAARTTNATSGADGTSGGASSFKSWTAEGGGYGFWGNIGTGASISLGARSVAVAAYGSTLMSGDGGGASGAASNGAAGSRGGLSGGGAGGGAPIINTSPSTGYSGGAGGRGGSIAVTDFGLTGGGGSAGSAGGGNGSSGASADDPYFGGSGGGGGGNGTAQAAGAGGAGGYPGGGGGGGGASNAGFNSGAGGAGADGYVRVTTYF